MSEKINLDKRSDAPPASYGSNTNPQADVKATRLEVIATAKDNVNISEPSSPAHPEYLYNRVEQSLSGHLRETDDTPGAERLSEMHKSGTFWEIHPDGTKVLRIYGDDFHISLQDRNLIVGGALNIVCQGDATFLTKGDFIQKVDGNYSLVVNGNMTTRVKGNEVHYTKGTLDIQTKSSLRMRAEGVFQLLSRSSINFQAIGGVILRAGSTLKMMAKARLDVFGNKLYMNSESGSKPAELKLNDVDPTSGVTVPDSLTEPAIDSLQVSRYSDNLLNSISQSDLITYPKDRTKNS